MEGKGCADDIKEGKLSFPLLIYFIESQNLEGKKRLEEIINSKRGNYDDLTEVQRLLNKGKVNLCMFKAYISRQDFSL